jgi:hypothetical protein
VVLSGLVLGFVDAEDDRQVRSLGGRRDDDLLRARGDVLRRGVAVGEQSRRLEDDVDAQRFPRKLGRILDGQHLELVLVHRDAVPLRGDVRVEVAEYRVVLQQMGQRVGVRQVIDRHDIDAAVAHRGAHDVAADAAEPVDPHLDCHLRFPPSSGEINDFNERLARRSNHD